MELPVVPSTEFTARLGVIAVDSAVTAAHCIWRPTSMTDVGIDGQIEYVTPDSKATGRLVLVQVKSGTSFFANASDRDVPYRPDAKHQNYWERSSLPVILCLHNPTTGDTYWVDARHEIRLGRADPIRVPKSQKFDTDGVLLALQGDLGPLPLAPVGPEDLFAEMRRARTNNADFNMSFLDLFVHGLTDICQSLYFGMDMVMEVAEARGAVTGSQFGVGIGGREYEFLDDYVAFVIAHDLVRFNYDWYRHLRDERELVATMLGPLTARGLSLVGHIARLDFARNVQRGKWDQVVVERFVQMVYWPGEMHARAAWIAAFEAEIDAASDG